MRVHIVFCLLGLSGSLAVADSPESPSIESLIESLKSNDFTERERALDGLALRRDLSEKFAPALRARLKDEDQATRQHAAMALAA